jgi:uncharacterized protein (DUF1778 family)
MSNKTKNKNTPKTINLRMKPQDRNLIDMAAKIQGKNSSDFILEAAKNAAETTLQEQTIFWVDPEIYAEFIAILDVPPQPNERLRKTMQAIAPWE